MIRRSYRPESMKVDADGRTIEGYASVTDFRDFGGDIVAKGAFRKSLKERMPLGRIKVMRNHETLIGQPMEAQEDDHGLFTRSLISETQTGNETLTLVKDGVLDGISIGFSIPKGGMRLSKDEQGRPSRIIGDMVLHEWSFVDFPMNDEARVTGTKALEDALDLLAQVPHAVAMLAEVQAGEHATPEQIKEARRVVADLDGAMDVMQRVAREFEPHVVMFDRSWTESEADSWLQARGMGQLADEESDNGVLRVKRRAIEDFARTRRVELSGESDRGVTIIGGSLTEAARNERKGMGELFDIVWSLPWAMEQLTQQEELQADARGLLASAVVELESAAQTSREVLALTEGEADPEPEPEPAAEPNATDEDLVAASVGAFLGKVQQFNEKAAELDDGEQAN